MPRGLREAHGGEPVDVLGLAVGAEPDALDAGQVEPPAHLGHGLLPEAAGRLADAAQAHGGHPPGPLPGLLLAGVGDDGLDLGGRAVAHAHVGAVRLDEDLLGGGVRLGRNAVEPQVAGGGALEPRHGLPGPPQ